MRYAALPDDVSTSIDEGKRGAFEGFPFYNTFSQLELTISQVGSPTCLPSHRSSPRDGRRSWLASGPSPIRPSLLLFPIVFRRPLSDSLSDRLSAPLL